MGFDEKGRFSNNARNSLDMAMIENNEDICFAGFVVSLLSTPRPACSAISSSLVKAAEWQRQNESHWTNEYAYESHWSFEYESTNDSHFYIGI